MFEVFVAQSRLAGDRMNGLVVGRRRIGVIRLHRDDRCSLLCDIYSLFLFFSLTNSQARDLLPTNSQNFATGWFETSGLSLLKPMSMSPWWQCRLSCGFARDNLSQRFGRDIGAPWRLQQEIHVMGQEEVYFWFYLAHINMYYMSCSCHLQMILSKIMYLRIITFVSKRELLQKKPSSETWKKRG